MTCKLRMIIKRKQFFYPQYFWHQTCGRFPYTNQFPTLWIPTGFPTNQFWHQLGLAQTPQVKGSVPQGCPHFGCQSREQASCTSDRLAVNWRFPTLPFLGLIICYHCSQNSGKHFNYDYQFIKKDTTQEQTDGRDAPGEVCGRELGGWRCQTLYGRITFPAPHQPGKLSEPHGIEFLSRFHYVGTVNCIMVHWFHL